MNVVSYAYSPEEYALGIHILADVIAVFFRVNGEVFGLQIEESMLLLHILADTIALILWVQHRIGKDEQN